MRSMVCFYDRLVRLAGFYGCEVEEVRKYIPLEDAPFRQAMKRKEYYDPTCVRHWEVLDGAEVAAGLPEMEGLWKCKKFGPKQLTEMLVVECRQLRTRLKSLEAEVAELRELRGESADFADSAEHPPKRRGWFARLARKEAGE